MLVETGGRAKERSLGLVVVLPYSASALVRRGLLEVLPELAELAIVPTIEAAFIALERSSRDVQIADERRRIKALRANVWENTSRLDELLARQDALLGSTISKNGVDYLVVSLEESTGNGVAVRVVEKADERRATTSGRPLPDRMMPLVSRASS